ncbi:MAG TPA: response regulator transcription factor [Ohtaekwangia sp.]|nr:response regulator transcription factor [Ohtaekwangia sp.]
MKILIADDHAIVRKGLIELLREEFHAIDVYEATNSQQAVDTVARQSPDVILLDISMPGVSGIETLKQLRANGVKAPILMLSMHPEDQYAIRSLRAGASGFINKETATEELLVAVHKVLGGKKYITPSVAEKLAQVGQQDTRAAHESLSDREMQVLQLIGSGKTVSEIAEQISLSVNTISTYRTRLLDKLGLKNNAELTRYALDHHLI